MSYKELDINERHEFWELNYKKLEFNVRRNIRNGKIKLKDVETLVKMTFQDQRKWMQENGIIDRKPIEALVNDNQDMTYDNFIEIFPNVTWELLEFFKLCPEVSRLVKNGDIKIGEAFEYTNYTYFNQKKILKSGFPDLGNVRINDLVSQNPDLTFDEFVKQHTISARLVWSFLKDLKTDTRKYVQAGQIKIGNAFLLNTIKDSKQYAFINEAKKSFQEFQRVLGGNALS